MTVPFKYLSGNRLIIYDLNKSIRNYFLDIQMDFSTYVIFKKMLIEICSPHYYLISMFTEHKYEISMTEHNHS